MMEGTDDEPGHQSMDQTTAQRESLEYSLEREGAMAVDVEMQEWTKRVEGYI